MGCDIERVLYDPQPLSPSLLGMQVIDYQIKLRDDSNPFGKVVSATLVVRGVTMSLLRSKGLVKSFDPDINIGDVLFDEIEIEEESAHAGLFFVEGDNECFLVSLLRLWDQKALDCQVNKTGKSI